MTYQPVQNRPTAAYVLSLLGGIFGIIGGFVLMAIGAAMLSNIYSAPLGLIWGGIGLWGLICGIIVIVSAVKLNANPEEHTKWGVLILVFSIIGVSTLFGFIGGILALVFHPETATTYAPVAPQKITRICPQCGRVLTEEYKFCPHCGKELA